MHTVHVITVLTTRRLVELVALVVLEAAVLCRMESVAVTVSGGGTTAGPVHLTEIRNYLHLTVSQSFSSPFRPSFAVFACTSHESPCVMSSLISPPLHAHIPYCIYLLSGPGSDSIFRVRVPGSDSIFRVRAPGSDSIFRVRVPGSDSIFRVRVPGSDSIFRVRAPGSDSFSRAPAPSVLPLSSPSSDSIFRVRVPGSDSFSRAPAPSVLPLSSPSSDCLKTHAPFPPSPHFVFFRELNIHHSNSISIYNKTIYHQT